MRKMVVVCLVLSFLLLCNGSYAENGSVLENPENRAASFTAFPGVYTVGEDIPEGVYEIRCARGAALTNLSVEDVEGKVVTRGEFKADNNGMLDRIKLVKGYSIHISDGPAYFAPSSRGIVFDSDISVETSTVEAAIDALKEFWKGSYLKHDFSDSGYLEIRNTRIIWIQDEPDGGNEASESVNVVAKDYFGNVECVVEFVLYSDYFGSAPYYNDLGLDDHVIFYADGTLAVSRNPFEIYRSRTFSVDFRGIIREVEDLGAAHNAVYRLLEE